VIVSDMRMAVGKSLTVEKLKKLEEAIRDELLNQLLTELKSTTKNN
jgi:hypothetical protein